MSWLYFNEALPDLASAQILSEPTVTRSSSEGLTLAWTIPEYRQNTVEIAGLQYSQFQVPFTTLSGKPGYPQLPLYSSLIGLPPTGEATLRIIELEQETRRLTYPPLPAPVPQSVHLSPTDLDLAAFPDGGPTARIPDAAGYATNAFYPPQVAELGPAQYIRDQRVAALTIYPLRVNPQSGDMEVIRFLRLEITFSQPASVRPQSARHLSSPDAVTQILSATLLNPESTQWATAGAPAVESLETPLSALSAGTSIKVIVNEAGLYALTYNDLQVAGLPVESLDPRTLQLSHGYPRQEVAVLVEGEVDGSLDPGDRLLFYAEPTFSRFVDYDVYLLDYGEDIGQRMANRSGDPAGLPAGTAWQMAKAELNQFYDPLYPARDGDHWYWDKLYQPDKTSGTYTIQLDRLQTSGPNATLKLWLQGYTDPAQDPDHRVRVIVNGAVVGEKTWNGSQAVEAEFSIAGSILKDGNNEIGLALPGVGTVVEGTWLDAMAVIYPTNQGGPGQLRFTGDPAGKSYTLAGWPSSNLTVYDVTNANKPQRVTNYDIVGTTLIVGDAQITPATYLIVPDNQVKQPQSLEPTYALEEPPGGADYIIITHPALASEIAPLAVHRAAQDLRVVTVEVQAIYDSFGDGRMNPEAIKNFLQYAYSNWPGPAPGYVLLVGDGSYDFKNYSGHNPQTLIPPYLAQVDPWWGETASDHRLVTLVGNDTLPDMLMGRLPVNTPIETKTVVDKIIKYETNPAPSPWNGKQLFVADNPDSAGNFHADADLIFNSVVSPFVGQRFYLGNSTSSSPYVYTDVEALRTSFLASFNSGAGLVTFNGHSSWHQWAVESLFALDDIDRLNNQDRLPIILGMTCFTGFFHHPNYATLDESLLRYPGGGAVAVWGSTGLGVSTGHDALQEGFYKVITTQAQPVLGAAILAGKMKLNATGFNLDLLDTFTLFGDPALALQLEVVPINYTDQIYLPLVGRTDLPAIASGDR